MKTIILHNCAKEDLKDIYEYISKDSIYYARKTIDEIINKISYLKDFPYMGRRVLIFNNYYTREIIYKSYRIIYVINSNKIYIHRVFHSARLLYKSMLKIN